MKSIDIIIPVYNGEKFLEDCLDSISFHDFYSNIIVVDNGSTDNTHLICSRYGLVQYVYFNEKQSSYAARNFGLRYSTSDYILFLDADVVLPRDFRLSLTAGLTTGPIEVIVKRVNAASVFDQNAYLQQAHKFSQNSGTTANLLVERSVIDNLNGFKELTSGADSDFVRRAVAGDFDYSWNNHQKVGHFSRENFKENLHKAKRLGQGHGQLYAESSPRKKLLIVGWSIINIVFPYHQLHCVLRIIRKDWRIIRLLGGLLVNAYAIGAYQRVIIIKTIFEQHRST
jgi:glycosyltransferase AglI